MASTSAGSPRRRPASRAGAAAAWTVLPPGHRPRTANVAQIYPRLAPPPETDEVALWVGVDGPDPLRPRFRGCSGQQADGLEVWLCTGRTGPWTTIRPAARTR